MASKLESHSLDYSLRCLRSLEVPAYCLSAPDHEALGQLLAHG